MTEAHGLEPFSHFFWHDQKAFDRLHHQAPWCNFWFSSWAAPWSLRTPSCHRPHLWPFPEVYNWVETKLAQFNESDPRVNIEVTAWGWYSLSRNWCQVPTAVNRLQQKSDHLSPESDKRQSCITTKNREWRTAFRLSILLLSLANI